MTGYFVDVRCLVNAEDLFHAVSTVENELREHILNSDEIIEHDIIKVKLRRDDFYDEWNNN